MSTTVQELERRMTELAAKPSKLAQMQQADAERERQIAELRAVHATRGRRRSAAGTFRMRTSRNQSA